MRTSDNDKELRALLKEVKLDSPSKDFTLNVMNRVWEEKTALSKAGQLKSEKILGRGFWIILAIFILLFLAVALLANNSGAETGQLTKMIQEIGNGAVSERYSSVFSNIGALPLSIGGILLASTLLLFIDRILASTGHKILTNKS